MKMIDNESGDSDEYNESDEELQEAFASGLLKPGLNIEVPETKPKINNIFKLKEKLKEIEQNLPWVERLDMINEMAIIAPELSVQIAKHEQKRANYFAGNAKVKHYQTDEDPILNDFKREMNFYRQAQSAAIEAIPKLNGMGIKTKRPDDYFAEMAKSDDHMQKIRKNLMAKQEGQAKSERIKQIREQRKMGKLVQREARVQRDTEKKDLLDKLKKFRKGKLKNLDFLEDNKGGGGGRVGSRKSGGAGKLQSKRSEKDSKFGFGGKKRGMKRNTKESTMAGDDFGNKRKFKKIGGNKMTGGGGAGAGKKGSAAGQRLGKNRRNKVKSKGKGRK